MKQEWIERALDLAKLIGMTNLAPASEVYTTKFKPVPTQALTARRTGDHARLVSLFSSGSRFWPRFLAPGRRCPRSASSTRCCCRRSPACCTTLGDILGRANVHESIAVTGAEVVVAFVIAVPLGGALGMLLAESDYIGAIFKPVLFYVFSIPKSIFLPMFILAFGIGFPQKVAYATFSTIFIVIMSASAAVESVKADHLLVARSLRRDARADLAARLHPEHDADPARDACASR